VCSSQTRNHQLGTLAVAAASVSEISRRPFLFGIGAGAAPTSRWADEQHAVGADIHNDVAVRHTRVEQLLDLTDEMWHPERGQHLRRDDFLHAARLAARDRPFITTAWIPWTPDLLDPKHPTRAAMAEHDLDRVILTTNNDLADFL